MKKRHYLTESDMDKIRNLIEIECLQQWKAAEIIGVHTATIEKVCRRLGLNTQRSGPRLERGHPGWKGGTILRKGYIYEYAPDHPNKVFGRYMAQHRLVMEKKLGRLLGRKEVVHHIDGNPLNNDPDNLIVFQTNAKHLRDELTGHVPDWTEKGREQIRKGVERRSNLYRSRPDGTQKLIKKYYRKTKSDNRGEGQTS